jgi:hypothetical protein
VLFKNTAAPSIAIVAPEADLIEDAQPAPSSTEAFLKLLNHMMSVLLLLYWFLHLCCSPTSSIWTLLCGI